MCALYWNLEAEMPCPCGGVYTGFQTHAGDGYCTEWVPLGEPAPALPHFSGLLSDIGEAFIGECRACGSFADFDARFEDGAVVSLREVVAA